LRKQILNDTHVDGDSGLGEICVVPVMRAQNFICISHTADFMEHRAITAEFEETNAPKLSLSLELFLFVSISSEQQETRRPGPERK
jgi:hypothetical protein